MNEKINYAVKANKPNNLTVHNILEKAHVLRMEGQLFN